MANKVKTFSKTKLDLKGKMLFDIVLISALLVGSVFVYVIANSIEVESKIPIMNFKEKSNVSYEVELKPNNYYATETLPMNQQYPANAIDKIKIKYSYQFDTDREGDYEYSYFTTANLIANNRFANEGTNPLVYSSTYRLEDQVSGKETKNNKYLLQKEYEIDYDTYNFFINNYKNYYGLTIDAYLKVTMYVQITDVYNDNIINKNKIMSVNIPLASNPISITTDKNEDLDEVVYNDKKDFKYSLVFIIIAIIMMGLGILLLIQEIVKILKNQKEQYKYINHINKIISSNEDVIVKSKNKISLKGYKVIDVESINDLLDVENELHIPIVYFETKKNKEGYFVIIDKKQVWRFIFKLDNNHEDI